jgi:hypothetical protein
MIFRQLRYEQEMELLKQEITEEIDRRLMEDKLFVEEKSKEVQAVIVSGFLINLVSILNFRNVRSNSLRVKISISALRKFWNPLSFMISRSI